jgi:hypothetical protein
LEGAVKVAAGANAEAFWNDAAMSNEVAAKENFIKKYGIEKVDSKHNTVD